ncbi:hypothetical protein [Leptospira santarosai]|uniref:hypothetical protein n=1 Tax=Leptospira santarosai TaxID=28183 RepID=UPI0024AFF28D|nr:hypothetical protein [Leptospira santarosai]MDI7209084.1 hypothetical protein [Leptospira santarosai]MDI7220370.1 hypothetical protein [Leptospira santarosai]MDI7226222.1 hypothetical protein [Leptospira santarosai]
MKPIDEIIEQELGRFLDAVKEKFYSEVEKGIQEASTGLIAFVTSDKLKSESGEKRNFGYREPISVFELNQCPFCKKFYFNEDKHSCKGNK